MNEPIFKKDNRAYISRNRARKKETTSNYNNKNHDCARAII